MVYGPSGYERNHLLAVVIGRGLDLGEPEEKERKDLPGPWPKGCQKVKGDGEGNGVRADCWLAYLESLWLKHYLSLPRGSDQRPNCPFQNLTLGKLVSLEQCCSWNV